tara:strand:+ start:512 stop:1489 length:978 start_codon:yes stop_codon:yes gene_type:complete
MRILHLSTNPYNYWSTYEGEYLNEALMECPGIELRAWGRFRPFFVPNLNAVEIVEHLYGNDFPDVVIVHSTLSRHEDLSDQKMMVGLEILRQRCILVWRTFDPWKLDYYREQYERYRPHIWLVWYPGYVKHFESMFDEKETKVYLFPHAVGRRYLNKMSPRPYDLLLLGRCQNDGKSVSKRDFRGLKVFQPRRFRRRTAAFAEYIRQLNLCKATWSSPYQGKYATLRFVEAPACGTLSVVPHHFDDLNEYYFPQDAYLVCEGNLSKAVEVLRSLDRDKDTFFRLQERAYKIVMNNHRMRNRVMYLIDILNGKYDADPRDYYGIPI